MRKQTKLAMILGAAAVMTFGACMTSFAATGWVEEDEVWYYYDSDGEAVTETWKKGADGKNYYLGEDGEMVLDSWVEGDDVYYYVNTHGVRITNEWRYMYGYNDSDDEAWYWFGSDGKMASSKKATVNGKAYYFDSDGKMITGWVDTDSYATAEAMSSDVVYCTEDGDRVVGWAKLYAPDDDDESGDEYWYNFSSTGKPRINTKKTISGKSYLFDSEGKMIHGWAYNAATGSDAVYTQIDDGDAVEDEMFDTMMYCGSADDGAMKKSKWIKISAPGTDVDDTDEDQNWYYLGSNGIIYTPYTTDMEVIASAAKYKEAGSTALKTDTHAVGVKKINSKFYGFREDGIMIDGLWRFNDWSELYNIGTYYFGSDNDGSMKTGAVTIYDDDDDGHGYYFAKKAEDGYSKGQGVSGIASGKLYARGLIIKATEDYKYEMIPLVDGAGNLYYYLVNESGKVMTSTSTTYKDEAGRKYKLTKADNQYGSYIITVTYVNGTVEVFGDGSSSTTSMDVEVVEVE